MRGLAAVLLLGGVASTAIARGLSPAHVDERARQVAEILEVRPSLALVEEAPADGSLGAKVEHLQRRQDALEDLVRVSLTIDATLARIQREQFEASSASESVSGRHERVVTNWNLAAVLVGNGITAVGTALQFSNQTQATVGDALIIGGAVVATAFSIVALVRRERGRPPHPVQTNFLARLLDRNPTPDSELPTPIWRYLDTPLVGEQSSFRQQLIERYTRQGSLSLGSSPAARRKIDLLTRPIGQHEVVSTEVLDLRAAMLNDLRTRVAAMNDDVKLLVHQLEAGRDRL